MSKRKKRISNVEVIDIAEKGFSLGRAPNGEIMLLQGAVPGDNIEVDVLRKKKGMKFGKLAITNTFSKFRADPFCQHFGTCGGCNWQNLQYDKQIELKEKSVRASIQRIAKDDPEKVIPIKKANRLTAYRNKLEYSFSNKRWLTQEEIDSKTKIIERNGCGFFVPGSYDKVVDIEQCHLQEDLGNQVRNYLKKIAHNYKINFYDLKTNEGHLRNVIIKNSRLNQWMVTLIFGELFDDYPSLLNELIEQFPQVTSWYYGVNNKVNSSLSDILLNHFYGTKTIIEKLGEVVCHIGPKSFFQTNPYQAEILYDSAFLLGQIKESDVVYDLYTGTGTIALYAAQLCKFALGIEEVEEAITMAHKNAEENNIDNVDFLIGDVKDVLNDDIIGKYGKADVIIVDPPRSGLHKEVVQELMNIGSSKIIYISCNPSTQARDILLLKDMYELIKCQPVDMFPYTSHIENVAILHKKLTGTDTL